MSPRIFLMVVISLFVHAQFCLGATAGDIHAANELYAKKKYDEALIKYKKAIEDDPESAIINYNLGTSLYKTGAFNQSIQHLQKALLAEEAVLKQKASYNLGNAMYKSGIAKEFEDVEFAILSLEKALKHYEEAIRLDEEDEDAKYNYEFVKAEIERLKQRQQQQQQKQQQQSQQSQDNQDQKQDQQQEQQEQQEQQQEQHQEPSSENQQQQQSQQDQSEDGQDQSQQDEGDQQQADDQQQDQESDGENEQGQSEDEKTDGEGENQDQSDYNDQMQAGTQGVDEGEMTHDEAQMLLRGFEQTEQPQKLLNVFRGQMDTSPVEKDW